MDMSALKLFPGIIYRLGSEAAVLGLSVQQISCLLIIKLFVFREEDHWTMTNFWNRSEERSRDTGEERKE